MEDKAFEVLTKMYSEFNHKFDEVKSEFQGVKADIQEVRSEFQGVKADIQEVKADIKKVSNQVIKLENEHGKKLDALFDGYQQVLEGQIEIRKQLNNLTSKVESQDVQITVLKGGKQATG